MPPRVITLQDLPRTPGELRVPKGTIITPAARDAADAAHVTIVFDTAPVPSPDHRSAPDASVTGLAGRIDHTCLAPDAVSGHIVELCAEAKDHRFAAVCVNPVWTALARKEVAGSGVKVCAVVGFPTGAHPSAVKAEEAEYCAQNGADEIDMVANAGWLRDGRYDDYFADIAAVRERLGTGVTLKVIIEAGLLKEKDIIRAAALAAQAGADFVKTSTGVYSKARVEDVQLLRRSLPPQVKIKAAGGIRTAADAQAMLAAGADRLGTSHSIAIIWSA